jgi:predicted metal-dependent hydrolase
MANVVHRGRENEAGREKAAAEAQQAADNKEPDETAERLPHGRST